jgi:hypothetical protein
MRILLSTVAVLVLIAYPGAGLRPSAAAFAAGSVHQVARPVGPSGPARHAAPFVDVAGVMAPHGNHTFVTDAGTATVTIWGANGQLNGILFDGIAAVPAGLTTDTAQNLYVANTGLSNVIVYGKPYTSIKRTLNDAAEDTEDVAVDKSGVVGVTNYLTTSLMPGSVSLYAKNATSACKVLQDPKWVYFYNDAFDASGNLFIDGQDATGSTLVGEVSGGCKATAITTLSVGNTISLPGGVQVSHGSILIGDVAQVAIYTYAPPIGSTLGAPIATTILAGAGDPVTFAIEENGKHVRTADLNSYNLYAALYTYPAGAFVSKLADHVWASAVAVYPPARP